VPQKYCTIDIMCVQRKTYSLERMKTVWRQSWWKSHHYATTFNWTTFSHWFES